jgi:hypothetical protein
MINETNRTLETIEQIPEINSKVTGSQTKGQFLASGVVCPHEDIILRSLKIVEENPSVATLHEDVRNIEVKNKESTEYIVTTFNHKIKILHPNWTIKAAIADTYKNKYNINIYIITYNDIYNSLLNLAQQLDNSEKIGIVLEASGLHDTPVILSKSNDELSIVVLDSIRIKPPTSKFIEKVYAQLMQEYGRTKCHLLYVEGGRQKDRYSCRNDAFIILKDALRKPSLINELFANSEIEQERNDKTIKDYQVNIAEFPKSLYKVVQNKQWLDKLSPEELQIPIEEVTSISTKLATKTLKTHLDKYNCKVRAYRLSYIEISRIKKRYIDWTVNFYLHIKGHRMLVKAFQAIDDGSGKVNQERANALVKKYVNPGGGRLCGCGRCGFD